MGKSDSLQPADVKDALAAVRCALFRGVLPTGKATTALKSVKGASDRNEEYERCIGEDTPSAVQLMKLPNEDVWTLVAARDLKRGA